MDSSFSVISSKSDERKWILQISEAFEKEIKRDETHISVCVFCIPKSLKSIKPEAYTPQLVALGPYHHFKTELYEMERYKLSVTKQIHNRFQQIEFQQIVDRLSGLELDIRSSYHKYLDFDGDTLSWIMAIDGLFLLELLICYVDHKDMIKHGGVNVISRFLQSAGKKLTQDALLRDIMKLENQIPFFILKEILNLECQKADLVENHFPIMLVRFCKALSPLKVKEDCFSSPEILEHAHLLDLLYHLILPQKEEGYVDPKEDKSRPFSGLSSNSIKVFSTLWKLVSNLTIRVVKNIKKILTSIHKVIKRLPSSISYETKKDDDSKLQKGVLMEGIMIPNASRLYNAGVIFSPAEGGIKSIRFEKKTSTLHIPVLDLCVNAEVVMRNLVAYEAMAMSDSLVFSRFMHFMNTIINTGEDVKLLRRKKIIVSRLHKNEDVANLFNGMSDSIGLTYVDYIDRAVKDVNVYYSGTPRVRASNLVKKYVFASWRILTFISTLLLLVFTAIQSVCSIYNCPQLFNTIKH